MDSSTFWGTVQDINSDFKVSAAVLSGSLKGVAPAMCIVFHLFLSIVFLVESLK